MITPLRYDEGRVVKLQDATVSDTTITKNDLLDYASGYLQRATNATTEVRFMAMEDKTTAEAAHEDLLVLNLDGVECEADTNASVTVGNVGVARDLTDHATIYDTTDTDKVFFVTEMVGASTDKKVRGYFCVKYL